MTLFAVSNDSGESTDPLLDANIAAALSVNPTVDEVWVFCHGWHTSFEQACADYNRFSAGLLNFINRSATRLALAIHWPSTLGDEFKPASIADLATFYTMEKRADVVGQNLVAGILYSLVKHQLGPLRINLIGHSFGCKVVCAALEAVTRGGLDTHNVSFNAVLLQAAFESDALEPGKSYGNVATLPVNITATRSNLDLALGLWFPLAESFEHPLQAKPTRQALGYAGPTSATRKAFGSRLVAADLTAAQSGNAGKFKGPSGSHSDIYNGPVYSLIYTATHPTPPPQQMRMAA